jgi:hypothetical protein
LHLTGIAAPPVTFNFLGQSQQPLFISRQLSHLRAGLHKCRSHRANPARSANDVATGLANIPYDSGRTSRLIRD